MQPALWSTDLEGSQQGHFWLQGHPHCLHRVLEVIQGDVRLDGNGAPVQLQGTGAALTVLPWFSVRACRNVRCKVKKQLERAESKAFWGL